MDSNLDLNLTSHFLQIARAREWENLSPTFPKSRKFELWSGLGVFWEVVGATWGLLERSWRRFGRLGGVLGPSWVELGASWKGLGASWRRFGASLGRLRRLLGGFWEVLETSRATWEAFFQDFVAS